MLKIYDPRSKVVIELTPKAAAILRKGPVEFFKFMYVRARNHAKNLQDAVELWQYTLEVVEAFSRKCGIQLESGWYAHLGSMMDPSRSHPPTSGPSPASDGRTQAARITHT